MKSRPRSAQAGWAKCIGRGIRGSIARSPSRFFPHSFPPIPLASKRFEREAKTISSLNHPHICVLHDVGHQDGIDYLVMECVEGETLAKRLEKGRVARAGSQVWHADRGRAG
jgi:serine/threonine protein kinase